MTLAFSKLDKWKDVIDSIDQDMIPIDVVKKVVFKLEDGTQKTINLGTLRKQGLDIEDIEVVVNKNMTTITNKGIVKLDFVVDINAVANRIEPLTKRIFRKTMNVRLVSYSKASEFETYEDGALTDIQDLVAYCARGIKPVSTDQSRNQ